MINAVSRPKLMINRCGAALARRGTGRYTPGFGSSAASLARLGLVRDRLGVAHALASRRLYVVGAQLLWDVSEEGELDPDARRALIVLRDGQYVFREVIERYLKRIEYAADDYADRMELPAYEVARIVADPQINFGLPFFTATGTPLSAVLSRLRAGETVASVADDFDLSEDEVTEAADRAGLIAA